MKGCGFPQPKKIPEQHPRQQSEKLVPQYPWGAGMGEGRPLGAGNVESLGTHRDRASRKPPLSVRATPRVRGCVCMRVHLHACVHVYLFAQQIFIENTTVLGPE